MPGTNPASLENAANRSPLQKGFTDTIPCPSIIEFVDSAGLYSQAIPSVDGAGIEINDGGPNFNFQGTATTTNTITVGIYLDDTFCENEKKFVWPIDVQKFDMTGSATDNTDLKIRCLVEALVPGATSLVTVIAANSNTVTLPAKTTTLAVSRWNMDILSGASSTVKGYLKRGTYLKFTFSPHETVGTDLRAKCYPRNPVIRRHIRVATTANTEPRY